MPYLTITIDSDIITIRKPGNIFKVYTLQELQNSVAILGSYYKELTEPTTEVCELQYRFFANNPPKDENGVYYWDDLTFFIWNVICRNEVYNFCINNNLFPITKATPHVVTQEEVDTATALWLDAIPQEQQLAGWQAWKDFDELLRNADFDKSEDRVLLLSTINGSCLTSTTTVPLCDWIQEYAFVNYGIPPFTMIDGHLTNNMQEQCKLCAFYSLCRTETGTQFLESQTLRLALSNENTTTEQLDTIRNQILTVCDTRNALVATTLGV